MSSRRRGSRRQNNNNNNNNNSSNSGQRRNNSSGSRRRKGSSGSKSAKVFWGDPTKFPDPPEPVKVTADPSAVIRSLGRPRLAGQEHMAELYYRAVSERAVGLASALAAAGDLVDDGSDES